MTKLISTRDASAVRQTYSDVLLQGLAPDGGLYVPQSFPQMTLAALEGLRGASYAVIAATVKKMFTEGSIPDAVIDALSIDAYSEKNFTQERAGVVTPVREVHKNFFIQNLSLGPTASFKDMAMQMLSREMHYQLTQEKKHLAILGATSGDTGSAAEAALKGFDTVSICMLSPKEGMSDFQYAQMGMLSGGNVHNVSIQGRFDDCQDLVKRIKQLPDFAHMGAVNSINFGRICSQIAYYVAGYLQVVQTIGDSIDVSVPSGNFGNVLSAYYAKQMGLPIRNLIVATNENAVLHRLFSSGVYALTPAQVTSSPSMDISKASNYERLVFDILGYDAVKTARYMQTFEKDKTVALADFGMQPNIFAEKGFRSGSSSHAQRLETIRHVHERSGNVIDPHTADGVGVALTYFDATANIPMLCMETALPVKFEHTIRQALGHLPERPERFADLESHVASDAFTTLPPSQDALVAYLRSIAFTQ